VSTTFLDAVLPSAGTYCVARINSKNKKAVQHRYCKTTQEIEQAVQELSTEDWNVYVAMATYADPAAGRTAANAIELKSLFIELDSHDGVPYASPADASKALKQFIRDTKLPKPTVVFSGRGVQAYWAFTEPVPVAQWLPVARALKTFCLTHGLKIDPQVTGDAARIMRMPGTTNYNSPDKPQALVLHLSEPIPFAELCALLPAPPVDLTAATVFGADDLTQSLARSGGDLPESEFAPLLDKSQRGTGCAQIAWAHANQPAVAEPMWRAVLSIAGTCVDADTAVHTISQGHPEYSPEATVAKAQRVAGKPYTCQWFKDNYPDNCAGCQHKITSPIVLGRTVRAAPVSVEDGAEVYKVEHTIPDADGAHQAVTVTIPAYPFPYYRGVSGGVYCKKTDADGEETVIEVYPQDLYLTSRFYDSDDHGDGEGELFGICLHLPNDGVRVFYAPATALLNKEKLQTALLKHGVVAYSKQWDIIMAYFASSIRKLQKDASACKTRSQMGWTPDESGFVVGEIEYTVAGPKLAPPASSTRQLAPAFQPAGTLDEWKSIANFYDRPGLEPHAFTLFCGFGSPLMALLGGFDVKGAVVNLVSNESGTGKTTAMMVKDSIFGNPAKLLGSSDDTYLAKFQHIGMLNNISPSFDEMTNTKPDELSDFVYSVTRGRARHRMDAQANKLRNNNTTWSCIVVTSSNSVFSDIISSIKATSGGEQARLMDIYVAGSADITKAEADEIFRKLASNYGVAGPIFMNFVINNKALVIDTLHQMQRKIDKALGLDKSDRFHSGTLAASFTGAYFAHRLGLIDINIGRVYQYMLKELAGIRVAHKAAASSGPTLASEILGRYINENINNTLIIEASRNGAPSAPIEAPRGALRIRYEPDHKELWIPATELREYLVKHQVDVKQTLQTLAGLRMLKNDGKSVLKRIAAGSLGSMNMPPVRCFCFDSDAVGIDNVLESPAGNS
jgi:hypothetical protein